MPQFDQRYTDLSSRGPDVFLTIARPKSLKPFQEGCEDRITDVRCLIDTGATYCALRLSLAGRLGLQEFNLKEIVNSTGKEWCPIYLVELGTSDGEWSGEYEVAGCNFGGQDLEFVLGRNFLEHAQFTYNGPLSSYSLKF
jgi:predicted aspartyl protease